MEDLEALVLYFLLPITLDVATEEIECGLVCLHWVREVVLVNRLALPQKRADRFDARGTLQVLGTNDLVEVLVKRVDRLQLVELQNLKNAHEDGSESFQIPVLVDDLVDNSALKHLVSLVGQQVN